MSTATIADLDTPPEYTPVYPGGSLHGPVIDDRGRWVKQVKPSPVGWLDSEGKYHRVESKPTHHRNAALRAS